MYPPTFWPLGWAIRSSKCTELLSQWGLCLQVRSWSKGPRYAPYNGLDAQGGGGLLCCSLLGSFCLFSLSLSKKLIKFLNFFFVKYQVNLDWFPYPDRELWCLHRAHWVTTGVVAGKRLRAQDLIGFLISTGRASFWALPSKRQMSQLEQ